MQVQSINNMLDQSRLSQLDGSIRFVLLYELQENQYIAYLGMEKGGVTPSVCHSMSVSHTTRNLQHECHRFSIIDQCLSVTPPGICGTFAAK
jgi:hypothetical protein